MFARLLLLATFFVALTPFLYGQNEVNIWYFSDTLGLNFNPDKPFVENNNSMSTVQGAATICDASGNLLFYTNGGDYVNSSANGGPGFIWNRNHEVMYEMPLLEGGGQSSRQTSIIIPKPGEADHYYLFTMDEREAVFDGNSKGLSYYEVDMNQNGGFGGVVDYTANILPNTREAIGACIHPNGQDYWIAVINSDTESLDVFSVNANGVNLAASSNLPLLFTSDYMIKFSPDGTKILAGEALLDFDNQTGQASNLVFLNVVECFSFSPNSQFLYSGNSNNIIRFDVTVDNVPSSYEVIATFDKTTLIGDMQVASDGNIYFTEYAWPGIELLSVIQCSNSSSPCVESGIISSFPMVISSFPNFSSHFFANEQIGNPIPLTIQTENIEVLCQGGTANLSIYISPDFDIEWSNGATTSSIEISTPGIYSVTINDGCCNTISKEINIDCEVTALNILNDDKAVKVFPNPATTKLNLECSDEISAIQQVEIYNIESKFISKITGDNIQEVDIKNLENGVYIIKLITRDGKIINKRIFKI